MLLYGILFGLGAATCQSLSYIGSRWFVVRYTDGAWRLLVWSHAIMGLTSLLFLPMAWSAGMPPARQYVLPLCGAGGFYLAGQAGLFLLMRTTEASRIAPLLALKILILAVISVAVMRQHLTLSQWLAAGLCVSAAFLLTQSGARLSAGKLLMLLFICTAYSLSDLHIAALVRSLRPLSPIRASVVGTCLTYVLCGACVLPFVPSAAARRQPGEVWRAGPFAAAWLISMVLLYACFAFVGPIYGNILQSTRGLISIMLGAVLAQAGQRQIEEKTSRRLLVQRLLAALLMTAAVWLFQKK